MLAGEKDLLRSLNESPINYTLLKMIHHELGNGLAVLSGYRALLQRVITAQARETAPPGVEAWQRINTQCLSYLHVMQDREVLLNTFLAQLRALSSAPVIYERLCQEFVRKDLVKLLQKVLWRIAPLYPACSLHISLPKHPLFIRCDPYWFEGILEHIFTHTLSAHTASTPARISLDVSNDNAYQFQEARIALRVEHDQPLPLSQDTGLAETWSLVLDQSEREICSAICYEVLQEHGGHIWKQQESAQKETIFLALPVAE